jgi:hypothetical protein
MTFSKYIIHHLDLSADVQPLQDARVLVQVHPAGGGVPLFQGSHHSLQILGRVYQGDYAYA